MNSKWRIRVFKLVLMALIELVSGHEYLENESSEQYLRTVMMELQGMKQSPSMNPVYLDVNDANFLAGKRLSSVNSIHSHYLQKPKKFQIVVDPMEISSSNKFYNQLPAPVKVRHEMPSYSKSQLSDMYKEALAAGNTINIPSVGNALQTGQLPGVMGTNLHAQSNPGQKYAYYFYPLKSFMNDVRNNNGYQTLNDLQVQPTNEFQESQKQIVMNPLFMAISGFLGMAVLFMLGVLLVPRMFGDFKSRINHDEFLDLTKTVSDSIETYNKTDTTRPKTRYPETIIGIKTRPRQRTSTKRRRKTEPTSSRSVIF